MALGFLRLADVMALKRQFPNTAAVMDPCFNAGQIPHERIDEPVFPGEVRRQIVRARQDILLLGVKPYGKARHELR